MRSLVGSRVELRNPEYTGENRCVPCTVVNAAIATAVGATTALLAAPSVGLALFLGGLAVIYLRGYLVPGTPTLTERYLPEAVRRLFGKDVASTRTSVDPTADGWDALESAGIASRTANGSFRLEDAFRDRWRRERRRQADTSPTTDAVAAVLGAEEVTKRGPRTFSIDGALLEWDSEAALAADVAASRVLESWTDGWDALERDRRRALLRRLRLLLERCPTCDGPVERDLERVDPCCQPARVFVWAACDACGVRLAEVGVPERDVDDVATFEALVGEVPAR